MNDKNFCPDIELKSSCFSLLTQEEWSTISQGQHFTSFREGEILLKQNAFSNYILFITEGYALKFLETDDARPVNLDILNSGDFVGLQALLGFPRCSYSYRALTPLKACMINLNVLKSLLDNNISFALRLLKRAAENENSIIQFNLKLIYKQMRGRLAMTLLFLTGSHRTDINVFRLLSRKDIADFAGISPINTVKVLKEFEKEGLIKLIKKDIYVHNRKELEHIASVG